MAFGTLTIGRLSLREDMPAAESNDGTNRILTLSGQEAYPMLSSLAAMAAKQEDMVASANSFVPVTFTDKSELNGYYFVNSLSGDIINYQDEMVAFTWKAELRRYGTDLELDLESRLTGATRSNPFGASGTGERWHAPAIGHYAYFTGSTIPSTMTRTGEDGAMTIYRSIPASFNPRWGCAVGNYLNGRVRFLDENSIERAGINASVSPSAWTLSNGLVKITPNNGASGVLNLQSYTGGAYRTKNWDIQQGGVSLGQFNSVSILRNDIECVAIRCLKTLTVGRVTVDITLRRGARFAELYVQTGSSSTLSIFLNTAETFTDNSAGGYVVKTTDDANANRTVAISAKAFTLQANGGITKASTTTLDAAIGVVVAGGSAVSGDLATDLRAQYYGAQAEMTTGVRR